MTEAAVTSQPAPANRAAAAAAVDEGAPPASPGWRPSRLVLPLVTAGVLIAAWHAAVRLTYGGPFATVGDALRAVLKPTGGDLFPTPWEVMLAVRELAAKGVLWNYIVSSLFRVTVGFALALIVGIPFGLLLGWFAVLARAFNPVIQVLRPISPIAWIPLAILWFGVDDRAPVFLIFLASVFPITVTAMAAVQNIQPVYVRAARNFGLSRLQLFRRVILPATMPQILTGVRITLGVAWLVVVAAEMLAVDPRSGGLGYLIIDARNAGKRYDLVVAGMMMIGLIGLGLDLLVRQMERFDEVRWGYAGR